MNIEKEIEELAKKTVAKPEADPVMAGFAKAAEHVRQIYEKHRQQGEEMATLLEALGNDFIELAAAVRETRSAHNEPATLVATNLTQIGEAEAKRNQQVRSGLIGASNALRSITEESDLGKELR